MKRLPFIKGRSSDLVLSVPMTFAISGRLLTELILLFRSSDLSSSIRVATGVTDLNGLLISNFKLLTLAKVQKTSSKRIGALRGKN